MSITNEEGRDAFTHGHGGFSAEDLAHKNRQPEVEDMHALAVGGNIVGAHGGQDGVRRKRTESFKEAALPMIKWLNDNCHPHHVVVITHTNAELSEGQISTGEILDYLKD